MSTSRCQSSIHPAAVFVSINRALSLLNKDQKTGIVRSKRLLYGGEQVKQNRCCQKVMSDE
jgi:hypothetical protein